VQGVGDGGRDDRVGGVGPGGAELVGQHDDAVVAVDVGDGPRALVEDRAPLVARGQVPGVMGSRGVPTGTDGAARGVVVDGGGVGQGQAHHVSPPPIRRGGEDGEGSGVDGAVRGAGVEVGEQLGDGPAVPGAGARWGEGGDVGDGGRVRVAEDQHVGQALPCVVDAAGNGDAALRVWTGGAEPGLVQAPGDHRLGFRCLPGCWWCVLSGGGRGCRPAALLVHDRFSPVPSFFGP